MKLNNAKLLVTLLGVLGMTLSFQNCGQPGSLKLTASIDPNTGQSVVEIPTDSATYTVSAAPSNKFICEPFGGSGAQAKSGLKAQLAYIDSTFGETATVKNAYSVLEYFKIKNPFVQVDAPLYLSQINVPSRTFDQGFKLSDGTYLSDLKSNKLIEYFGLQMQSVLKLSDTDPEGLYELATISDDGSILNIASQDSSMAMPATMTTLINNDGAHSTRMKCATKAIEMTRGTRLPISYYYNQGPRTEITNVMVWRYLGPKVDSDAVSEKYSLCDVTDRLKFWNPANSEEGVYVTQLKADGFKIIDSANYELPDAQINPCSSQAANQIKVSSFSNTSGNSTTLNIQFISLNNVTAKLYKIVNGSSVLVANYDYSTQLNDKLAIQLNALELNVQYQLEFTLKNPNSQTSISNEVKFMLQAKNL